MMGERQKTAKRLGIKRFKRVFFDLIPKSDNSYFGYEITEQFMRRWIGHYKKNNVSCSCYSCVGESYKSKGKNKRKYQSKRFYY